MTTLSVIIPTHNRIAVLKQALHHLAANTVAADEVIIIDDGSEEPAAESLDLGTFGFRDSKVIRLSPGRGAPAARNTGARAARGDVIVFMDDDIFPDQDMLRYHKRIHEEHPEPEYGVMGRIYFDPDLPRTPLMHFVEERGYFTAVSRAADRSPVLDGLISANFSLKRRFIECRDRLFDERFPFNRNEDTELGVRMVAEGWKLHHHIAPSARHHSPLDLDTFWRQIRQGGISKAYWSLTRPDDTRYCLLLEQCARRKLRESELNTALEVSRAQYGERFLSADVSYCATSELEEFHAWINFSVAWIQDIGQLDGWAERTDRFDFVLAHLRSAFEHRRPRERLPHLRRARQAAADFLPLALLLANELTAAGDGASAMQVLEPFRTSVWATLLRCRAAHQVGDLDECERGAREVYGRTGHGTAIHWEQRRLACEWLAYFMERGRLDTAWIASTWETLTDADLTYNQQWVYRLATVLGAQRRIRPNESLEARLARLGAFRDQNARLKQLSNDTTATLVRAIADPVSRRPRRVLARMARRASLVPSHLSSYLDGRVSPWTRLTSKKRPGEAPLAATGRIKWISPDKRFGFTTLDGSDRVAFVHGSNLQGSDAVSTDVGASIAFTVHETSLGLEARAVQFRSNRDAQSGTLLKAMRKTASQALVSNRVTLEIAQRVALDERFLPGIFRHNIFRHRLLSHAEAFESLLEVLRHQEVCPRLISALANDPHLVAAILGSPRLFSKLVSTDRAIHAIITEPGLLTLSRLMRYERARELFAAEPVSQTHTAKERDPRS